MRGVEIVLFLVVLGTVVAVFARRLRVPAPSLLVVAGLLVGLLPVVPEITGPACHVLVASMCSCGSTPSGSPDTKAWPSGASSKPLSQAIRNGRPGNVHHPAPVLPVQANPPPRRTNP